MNTACTKQKKGDREQEHNVQKLTKRDYSVTRLTIVWS